MGNKFSFINILHSIVGDNYFFVSFPCISFNKVQTGSCSYFSSDVILIPHRGVLAKIVVKCKP